MAAPDTVVRLDDKFAALDALWTPKIVGQINDMHLKVVRVHGEFVWHVHDDTDEFFLVESGSLTIELADRPDVTLGPGEFFVVPSGVHHRPVASEPCHVVLLEPAGVVNTGEGPEHDLTAPRDEWI